MNIDPEFVSEVERLRKAARENEVVKELLVFISALTFTHDDGSEQIVEVDKNLIFLEICKLSSAFAEYDQEQSDLPLRNHRKS